MISRMIPRIFKTMFNNSGFKKCLFLGSVLLLVFSGGALTSSCPGQEPATTILLKTNAVVDSEGIFLAQVIEENPEFALPQVRLADPPTFGQAAILTRAQIIEAAQKFAPAFVSTNFAGAERVRITRRAQTINETQIKELLTATLQRDHVRDKGELELRFVRPWTAITIPDEPFVLNLLDLPANGIGPNVMLRFELRHGRESLGTWQLSCQTHIWRETWVARSALRRGQLLRESDLRKERKDILILRDTLGASSLMGSSLELTENIQEGAPLLSRSVKIRPSIRRGELVEAILQEGALSVSLRVEVLEDGLPGQLVRIRNPQSKRELRGKVQNEQTILIAL
jgi:flagella basal body P-ring formation protein FlgA